MRAAFRGWCAHGCEAGIEPGDEIEPAAGGRFGHVECPESADDRADRVALASPRCGRCGLNHPGEC